MKATMVIAALALLLSCGGGREEAPPPTGPAPLVRDEAPQPVEAKPAEPTPEEAGAVWGERVEHAFVSITVDNLMPAPARAIAEVGWAALDGAPGELPADDAALAHALRTRAAVAVGSKALPPERVWAAIAAMVAATDNVHVMLLDAPRAAQFGGAIGGEPFVTPGVMVHWTPDGELAVSEVFPGAPAANAGIVVGDVITRIDGHAPSRVAPLFEAMFRPAGETIVLGVRHRVLKGGVGLIRLYFCGLGDATERNHVALTRAALDDLDKKRVSRVVIDLRGNMGGGGVAQWASIFTKDDPILFARQRQDTEDFPWQRKGDASPKAHAIAVLVDEQTISCGEMLGFALAEHGAARLFGQPTGKALNVPDEVDLGEGYTLMIPKAAVFGPKTHVAPEGHLVTPDEIVPNRSVADLMAGKDPQLDAALRWLAKQKPAKH